MIPNSAILSVAQSTTDSSVVAAVTGRRIRVTSAILTVSSATTITFNSKPASAGVAISGAILVPTVGLVLPHNPNGWFDTVAGQGLTVTTGSGATIGGQVCYEEH